MSYEYGFIQPALSPECGKPIQADTLTAGTLNVKIDRPALDTALGEATLSIAKALRQAARNMAVTLKLNDQVAHDGYTVLVPAGQKDAGAAQLRTRTASAALSESEVELFIASPDARSHSFLAPMIATFVEAMQSAVNKSIGSGERVLVFAPGRELRDGFRGEDPYGTLFGWVSPYYLASAKFIDIAADGCVRYDLASRKMIFRFDVTFGVAVVPSAK